jgi:23S rRNA pseudouridine1911/1915/1917 synthase
MLPVLFEDNHLLIVNKPARLATMGVGQGTTSALTLAKTYLKHKYQKPGNVYLGVVSRLDSLATGALVFARTSKAAARLTEQFKQAAVEKTYWALVEGILESPAGEWTDYLSKDEAAHRMRLVTAQHEGAQRASLAYRRFDLTSPHAPFSIPRSAFPNPHSPCSLVEIQLRTGRKHQIRVQFADRGHPILGDKKYGSTRLFPNGIALHSRRLAFQHPTRNERIEVEAPLPDYWPSP